MAIKVRSLFFTIMAVGIMSLLQSCEPTTTTNSEPTTHLDTPTISSQSTIDLIARTPTLSPTLAPISTQLSPIVPTGVLLLTPTLTPQPSNTMPTLTPQPASICTTPPNQIDIQTSLGIDTITHLNFINDFTLSVSGWASIEYSETTSFSTPNSTPFDGIPSSNISLQTRLLNIRTGEIISQTSSLGLPLQNLCQSICNLTVISQSQNGLWQLIHATGSSSELNGVWLVSQNEKIRIVNYIPYYSTWDWSFDNTLFWYIFSDYDFGQSSLIVQLDTATIISANQDQETTALLFDATHYSIAFDPEEKTILATSSEEAFSDNDELFSFDLTKSLYQPIESKIILGIKTVVWNQATQSYLLIVVQENSLNIWDENRTFQVQVPQTIFNQIFPVMESYNIGLEEFLPNQHYALSPSGQYLVIGYDTPDGIFLFECQKLLSP